jgi:hypothetical protein
MSEKPISPLRQRMLEDMPRSAFFGLLFDSYFKCSLIKISWL